MSKTIQALDYSVDVASGSYALANIHEILGIILLVLSICSILYKMIYTIIVHAKNKEYKEIADEIEKAKEEIENFKESDFNDK